MLEGEVVVEGREHGGLDRPVSPPAIGAAR